MLASCFRWSKGWRRRCSGPTENRVRWSFKEGIARFIYGAALSSRRGQFKSWKRPEFVGKELYPNNIKSNWKYGVQNTAAVKILTWEAFKINGIPLWQRLCHLSAEQLECVFNFASLLKWQGHTEPCTYSFWGSIHHITPNDT